jgi:hypothetical protein
MLAGGDDDIRSNLLVSLPSVELAGDKPFSLSGLRVLQEFGPSKYHLLGFNRIVTVGVPQDLYVVVILSDPNKELSLKEALDLSVAALEERTRSVQDLHDRAKAHRIVLSIEHEGVSPVDDLLGDILELHLLNLVLNGEHSQKLWLDLKD